MSVRVFAPAKVNLTLQVGAPRADGLHPLKSAVMFADIGDWIEAARDDEFRLSVLGPFASGLDDGADNLVLRAARALAPERAASLRLEKNLPVASGIGGGSADAAAALRALNELWALRCSEEILSSVARGLGADVPVCLSGKNAWMSGAGEIVGPLHAPRFHAVLLNPGRPLATAAVYKKFDEMDLGRGFHDEGAPAWDTPDAALADIKSRGNDLEAPAAVLAPEIGAALRELRSEERVLHAGLSGSGSTMFALMPTAEAADGIARAYAARNPRWWVQPCTLGCA
ncbi:MAG: 4-(cytidine 5'-diphospho)-2-C-methyl-D-erythritol kinase [Hyphomonadaceae bacterium]